MDQLRRPPDQRARRRAFALAAAGVLALAFGLALYLSLSGTGSQTRSRTSWTAVSRSSSQKLLADRAFEESATFQPAFRASTALDIGFDTAAAVAHVRALERIGVRAGGSDGERRAAEYLAAQLESFGYDAEIRQFPLPNGKTSRNVVASLAGSTDRRVVVGAHYDTKAPSPGANDNGSGTAAVLVIAKALAGEKPAATIEFVFFGSEETIDSNPDHHHFGSRFHAASMSAAEKRSTVAMFSVDMIAYGPSFHVRTMESGPRTLSDDVLAFAKSRATAISYLKDPGKSGWSDHEPFERAGIPSVWLEWRDDPVYHTAGDVTAHLQTRKLGIAGGLVLDYLRAMDESRMARLRP